ncbi:MAG TPA: hypothetical protein VEM13_05245 [Gemmatimonadales bacterium]|nr:hypothetical protein [Gemmatimonadales bacterium]
MRERRREAAPVEVERRGGSDRRSGVTRRSEVERRDHADRRRRRAREPAV